MCSSRQARRHTWRPGLIQIWFGQGSNNGTGSPHEAMLSPGFMLVFETAAPEVLLADLVKSSIVTVRKAVVALEVTNVTNVAPSASGASI